MVWHLLHLALNSLIISANFLRVGNTWGSTWGSTWQLAAFALWKVKSEVGTCFWIVFQKIKAIFTNCINIHSKRRAFWKNQRAFLKKRPSFFWKRAPFCRNRPFCGQNLRFFDKFRALCINIQQYLHIYTFLSVPTLGASFTNHLSLITFHFPLGRRLPSVTTGAT